MKKALLLVALLFTSSIILAQVKEKIKGSKIITHAIHELESFENIEVEDNLEVYLVKGDKPSIEIEADDNLHDAISYNVMGNTLRITSQKDVVSAKKFSVRINYVDNLKLVIAKNETKIFALNDLQLESITIKNYGKSSSFLNVKATDFTLILNDKSKAEINIKAQNTVFEISKNAELKSLLTTNEFKLDMYEKSEAQIEGDVVNGKFRLDNNANLTGKKMTCKTLEIISEHYAKSNVNVVNEITIESSGKSEIELYGEPKIIMKKFSDNAILLKK
jgi:hypothetical protein